MENVRRGFQIFYWSLVSRLRNASSIGVIQPLKPRGNYKYNRKELCILFKCDYVFCTILTINIHRFPEEHDLVMQSTLHILMYLYGFTLLSGSILVERGIILK